MATLIPLSGDTSLKFRPINVTATTAGTAQTAHTHIVETGVVDQVFLEVWNLGTTTVRLTVLKGGTDLTRNAKFIDVEPAGADPKPVYIAEPLAGGDSIKVFAGTTAVLNISGKVLRGVAQ